MVRDLGLGEAGAPTVFQSSTRANPAQVAIAWVMGGLATMAAVVLASILAVVFAAPLAFVLVLAAAVLTFLAVVWRFRRSRAVDGAVIEARKVGHSWVPYGWDRQS